MAQTFKAMFGIMYISEGYLFFQEWAIQNEKIKNKHGSNTK